METLYLQFWQKINVQTSKFARKLHFLGIRKVLNLGLKAEKPLQNENHTEDWALGSHPRVLSLKSFYKYSKVHLHSLQMVF